MDWNLYICSQLGWILGNGNEVYKEVVARFLGRDGEEDLQTVTRLREAAREELFWSSVQMD